MKDRHLMVSATELAEPLRTGGLRVLNLRVEYDVICSACRTEAPPA